MKIEQEQALMREVAQRARQAGYRAFLSYNQTYGFYTDEEGTRVISFQPHYFSVRFSGNYVTSSPRDTGTGWGIADLPVDENLDEFFHQMMTATPPHEYVRGCSWWKYASLLDHFDRYQRSSLYKEELS